MHYDSVTQRTAQILHGVIFTYVFPYPIAVLGGYSLTSVGRIYATTDVVRPAYVG